MRKDNLLSGFDNISGEEFGEISYFGDNDLSLRQFKPGGNDSKNRSERFRDNKKLKLCFWSSFRLAY